MTQGSGQELSAHSVSYAPKTKIMIHNEFYESKEEMGIMGFFG